MNNKSFEHQTYISDSGVVEKQDVFGITVTIISTILILLLITLGILTLFF